MDVAQELPDVNALPRGTPLKLLTLARGQTADTLFENAEPGQRSLVNSLAGMDAANGLGQLRGIGTQAET